MIQRLADLMRTVHNDHDGVGALYAYRAFDRAASPSGIAFIDLVILPPGSSVGLHRHGDDEETYVILRGSGTMTLDDETFPVTAGDLIANHAYGRHGLVNDGHEDLHLLVFEKAPA
ncbi:cupin domain-containing protein [Hamadaea tsunoensis]|uniref:cupin domain-containing protein n=1 Tax=Hamadaea tsunoensis TaxID=53368 RepID=UPI000415D221|nr:cupin domain-containing protein [Hamadaea tsunoensis]